MLLTTDGSPDASDAAVAAARVFRREDLEADLVCVVPHLNVPEPPDRRAGERMGRLRDDYRKQMGLEADRILGVALEALAGEGLAPRPHTEHGSPGDVILRWSAACDVTVVGAHDRFGRNQSGIGPAGHQAIATCPSSVLVGRELPRSAPSRVLLCMDGSAGSGEASRRMAAHVRLEDATVTVIHVMEMPWLRLGLDADWLDSGHRREERVREAFESESDRIVEEAKGALEERGIRCETRVTEGLPAAQILSEAEVGEYDLIVLGATGRSDLTHSSLGSAALRIADGAPTSVWVVR